MECFIVKPSDLEDGRLLLRGEEAHHAIRSMRLKAGDQLLASDLRGVCYICRIGPIGRANISEDSIECSIEETLPEFGEPDLNILLIQGMIGQPSRWEFLIEKATELGVAIIQPVITEHTERIHFKSDRSDRILRAAVKQTKRARIPELRIQPSGELYSLQAALSHAVQEGRSIVLLHESAAIVDTLHEVNSRLPAGPIAIVIGPEGGFSEAEVEMASTQHGAILASLGARRLRAETAAIAALAILI